MDVLVLIWRFTVFKKAKVVVARSIQNIIGKEDTTQAVPWREGRTRDSGPKRRGGVGSIPAYTPNNIAYVSMW